METELKFTYVFQITRETERLVNVKLHARFISAYYNQFCLIVHYLPLASLKGYRSMASYVVHLFSAIHAVTAIMKAMTGKAN